MKNSWIILLVCSIGFLALSYGLVAGTFKIFPYESYNFVKQIVFSELDRDYPDKEDYIYSTNPSELIKIENKEDIFQKRSELIKFVWKENSISNKMPDRITENFISLDYNDIENLKQIDKIYVTMEYGVDSKAYHFIPKNAKNSVILYHQGHGGDFLIGKNSIKHFIEDGFHVVAFSMPLYGKNNQPIVETDFGTIKLLNHNHLIFLEKDDFTAMKFFFEPISRSLNYLEQNYEFEKYIMVGLSGGGLITTIYPAIDDRILESYSVAGSHPIYLEATKKRPGHYEYLNMDFYRIANYLELYVMASYGEERKFVQIFNEFDLCCYEGTWYETYQNSVKNRVEMLEKGEFTIFLDSTHKEHKISEYALNVIKNSINQSKEV